jgi:hypothetical protein
MGDVTSVLLAFAVQWSNSAYPPIKVEKSDLNSAEASLGILFPEDYRAEVLSVGLPRPTLALLSAILEQRVELQDLSALNTPQEIVEETEGWREAGMPANLVVIGNDSLGNKFCFDKADLQTEVTTSARVYFWDHDFGTVDLVADSFSEWIGSYSGDWSDGLNYKDF